MYWFAWRRRNLNLFLFILKEILCFARMEFTCGRKREIVLFGCLLCTPITAERLNISLSSSSLSPFRAYRWHIIYRERKEKSGLMKYPLTRTRSPLHLSPFVGSCVSFSADSGKHSFVPISILPVYRLLRFTGVSVKKNRRSERDRRMRLKIWSSRVYPIRLVAAPAVVI